MVHGGGGGFDYFTFSGYYNTTTGAFKNEPPDYSQMVRSPPTGALVKYTRTLVDGSTEIYSLSNGAAMVAVNYAAAEVDGPACVLRPGDDGFEECEACQ